MRLILDGKMGSEVRNLRGRKNGGAGDPKWGYG